MLLKLRYITIALDYPLLLGALVLAYFVRVGFIFSSDLQFEPFLFTSLATAVVWIGTLIVFRGYSSVARFDRFSHWVKVLVAGLTGTASFGLIFYFTEQALFSRLLLLYLLIFGSVLMIVFHLLMDWLGKTLIKKGYGNIRVLIIGSNRGVKSFINNLKNNVSPYVPVAILDGYGTKQKEISGVPVLGKLNILEETIDEYHIQAIVQGDNVEQVVNIVHFCEQHHLAYYLLPYLLGMFQGHLTIQHLEQPLITSPRFQRLNIFEKFLG